LQEHTPNRTYFLFFPFGVIPGKMMLLRECVSECLLLSLRTAAKAVICG
jgi:hypothetical protein